MKKKVSIKVIAYFDNSKKPTCATDFRAGDVCQFYRTQRYGSNETCVFAPESEISWKGMLPSMRRRKDKSGKDGNGTLIPGKWCPLHPDACANEDANEQVRRDSAAPERTP